MIVLICIWFLLLLGIISVGIGVSSVLQRVTKKPHILYQFDMFDFFWIGFGSIVAFLSWYSVFFPFDTYLLIVMGLITGICIFLGYSTWAYWWFKVKKYLSGGIDGTRICIFCFVICIILFSLSFEASKNVSLYDTLLYHINAVDWINRYPAIPGLANFHIRLGFNSSFFLFAAMVNIGTFQDFAVHIALPFLFLIVMGQWLYTIFFSSNLIGKIYCFLTIPYLFIKMFGIEIVSFSTDVAMSLVFITFFLYVLQLPNSSLLQLGILASLGYAFKLSGLLLFIPYCIFLASHRKKDKTPILIFVGIPVFIVAGFILRNCILSGWPGFPLPIGKLPVDWAVPEATVRYCLETIKAFSRKPYVDQFSSIHNDFLYWFIPWFKIFRTTDEYGLLISSVMGLMIVGGVKSIRAIFLNNIFPYAISFLSVIASLAVWAYSAPNIRFGSVYFWVLFALSLIPIFVYIFTHSELGSIAIIVTSFMLCFFLTPRGPSLDVYPPVFNFIKVERSKENQDIRQTVIQGITVWQPILNDMCGYAPLLCTPTVENGLQFRVEGNIRQGFIIRN